MRIARVATRVLIGGLFVGHGTQKLMGAFNGPGIEGTEQMMTKLEMNPPKAHAYGAGLTETIGGAMFAAGAATPLSGAALIGTMITAIRKVHLNNGPWNSDGGYEYNLVLIAAILSIIEGGTGAVSVDRVRGKHQTGVRHALAALLLGAAASTAVIELSKPKEQPEPQPTPAEPAEVYPASAPTSVSDRAESESVRSGAPRG
jgi:putative oxidoreductase